MRKIGICVDFMNYDYKKMIDAEANSLGFIVDYCDSSVMEEHVGKYEVIYGNLLPTLLKKAKSLKWFCCVSAGVEKYISDEIWPSNDCLFTNSSGAFGPTIAEHITMVLLMLFRKMPEYARDYSERVWKAHSPIRSIMGSRIIVINTGDIGSNTARRLKALGAEIIGVNRGGISDEPAFDRVLPIAELDSVLPQADALILALPATTETRGLLSRERIALLPETAYVINVGRGSTIDQDALVDALKARRIAGAALDVMVPEPLPANHDLWSCPNTIITPHCSGSLSLKLTRDLEVKSFCDNLRRYAAGLPLEHIVNRKRGY